MSSRKNIDTLDTSKFLTKKQDGGTSLSRSNQIETPQFTIQLYNMKRSKLQNQIMGGRSIQVTQRANNIQLPQISSKEKIAHPRSSRENLQLPSIKMKSKKSIL